MLKKLPIHVSRKARLGVTAKPIALSSNHHRMATIGTINKAKTATIVANIPGCSWNSNSRSKLRRPLCTK